MKTIQDNLAFVLLGLFALILIFFVFRLQGLILTNQPTAAAGSNEAVAENTPEQPAQQIAQSTERPSSEPTATNIATPDAATPTLTPIPVLATSTPTPAGYTIYGATVIGAIHVGAINDRGYNQAHHDGLQQAINQTSGLRLIEVENVPEDAMVNAIIDQMVSDGAQIIFGQSFGYLPYLVEAAHRHPQVTFLHPGGFELAENLGTYWANNFEAMYLAGIAAGSATQSNQLGFITAFPIPNILASVNAFHLGARAVNPNVTTRLVINEAWVDPTKEANATHALGTLGVDVVTMIVDSPIAVVQTAESRGMFVIGFHSASLQELAPRGWLTGVDYTWGNFYTQVIQQVRTQTWQPGHIRGGIESDMLQLAPFGSPVSEETKTRILQARTAIISGQLRIFQGPIRDNQSIQRIPAGQTGGIELLDTTDWLVEGISRLDVATVDIRFDQPPPVQTTAVSDAATDAAAASPGEASVVESAPLATETATPTPALISQPTADYYLGYLERGDQCGLVTEIVERILEGQLGFQVESTAFTTTDELFDLVASPGTQHKMDWTMCYTDPTDRSYLAKYSGFIGVIGGSYRQSSSQRYLIISNPLAKSRLQQEQPCVYQLLRNLQFDDSELQNTDASTWLEQHADLVQEWTRCS